MVRRDDDTCSLHFFQPLMPGFSMKLAVPTGFVKRIMKEKFSTKTATLVCPNSEQWHVDICKDNRQHDVYFCGHGWLKFVHAHNLGLGYFLVFCYRGNMMFDVRAYDLSTCEIASYASSDAHKEDSSGESGNAKIEKKKEKMRIKVENEQSENVDKDDEVEIIEEKKWPEIKIVDLEESDESTHMKRKIPGDKAKNKKKIEHDKNKGIEKNDKTKEKYEIQQELENANKDEMKKKKTETAEIKIEDLEESDEFTLKKKRKTSQERIESSKKSDKFANKRLKKDSNCKRRVTTHHHERKRRNNWSYGGGKASFEVTIWPCNVYSSYLNIPWRFSDANGLTERKFLNLKDPKGRSWPVRLVHRRTRFGNPRNTSYITVGWREFAVANDLKEGDNCRLELASEGKNGKVVMQVEMRKNVV